MCWKRVSSIELGVGCASSRDIQRDGVCLYSASCASVDDGNPLLSCQSVDVQLGGVFTAMPPLLGTLHKSLQQSRSGLEAERENVKF